MENERFGALARDMAQQEGPLQAILLALGAASMCWEHVDRAGVFQSEDASTIADVLYGHLYGEPVATVVPGADEIQRAVDEAAANPGKAVHVAGGYVTSEHGPEITRSER